MSTFEGLDHIVRENEPLAPLTWFRLGGAAQYFAEPTKHEELAQLVKQCHAQQLPVRVIGAGSRILVPDEGVEGLVVQLSAPAFCQLEIEDTKITAGGGVKLGHLVSTAVGAGLAGIENLVGIPGSVAGAIRGNSHSGGTAIGQWTTSATVMTRTGDIETRAQDQLHFSYGQSNLDEPVILSAEFTLERGDADQLTRHMQKAWIVRRSRQPSLDTGIARIFKDAQGVAASELIEQAGMKQHQVGKAKISEASANFVEVESGGTCADVKQLIADVRQQVADSLGVELDLELEIW